MASRGSARLREASPVAPGPAAPAAAAAPAPSKRRESPRESRTSTGGDGMPARKQADRAGAGAIAAAATTAVGGNGSSGAAAAPGSSAAPSSQAPVGGVAAAASGIRARSARLREAKESDRGSASAASSSYRVELATRLPDGRLVTLKMTDADDAEEDAMADVADDSLKKLIQDDSAVAAAAGADLRAPSPLRNGGAPSPDGSIGGGIPADEEGDESRDTPSGRLSRMSNSDSKKDEQQVASSPSPALLEEIVIEESEADKEERAALLARRIVVDIPPLKPRGPLIAKDALPRYIRPPLRHVVTEERRIVQVRPSINQQAYPEQLIDDTMTQKNFVPVPATNSLHPQPHGNISLMAPLGSSRSPLVSQTAAPGGTSLLHNFSRHQSLTHSPGFLARKVSNPPNTTGASSAMSDVPGSPNPRMLPNAALPMTPVLLRQPTQLTYPLPPTQVEGPPTNIVTQLIPYGRIEIVPTRSEPVLCASMVPLSATSTAHQWYLPRSQPSSLYVTLELPGHVDFEIRVDNVFVLPAKFDQQRLEQQQKLICEGKLVAVNQEAEGTGAAGAAGGAKASHSAPASQPPPSKSVLRRGGHLQRKKCMKSELQQLLEQDESCMAESVPEPADEVDTELARDYARITQFGLPTLQDVQVTIKSAGQHLVPAPAKVVQVPVRDKVMLPSRAEAEKRKKMALNNLPTPAPPAAAAAAAPAAASAAAAAAAPVTGATVPPGGVPVTSLRAKALEGVNTLPGEIVATETKFIPKGPSTLSMSTPHISFGVEGGVSGSITLQRYKPRLGGWVVRRDISVALANTYEAATLVPKGQAPIVKTEPQTSPTPLLVKIEPEVQVKLEEGTSAAAPPSVPIAPEAAASVGGAGVGGSVAARPDPRHPVLVDKPYSAVYEPASLSQSQHDIAEAGDVIRLVIDVPAPQLKPRYKPILAMHYELLIEGLRVLPTAAAPMFPTPLDMYRYGTAPKELVREAALSTRLQSSVVPSEALSHNQQLHWSRLGLPLQPRGPVVLPEAMMPSDDESSEDESSKEEEEEEEKKGEEKSRSAKAAPSPFKLAYQRLMAHPQQNMSEYYLALETPLADSELSENELLEMSDSSSDDEYYSESDSQSDAGSGDEFASDVEYHSDRMDMSDEESPRKVKAAPNSGSNRDKGKTATSTSSRTPMDKITSSRNQQPPSRNSQSDSSRKSLPNSARPPSTSVQKHSVSTSASSSSSKSSSLNNAPQKRSQGSSSSSSSQRASSSSGGGSSSHNNNSSSAPAALDSSMDYVTPEEVWACCDKCGKWRKLPPGIREEELPAVWFCHMNPDTTHNLCKHPEEQETQDSYAINPPAQTSAAAAATPTTTPTSSAASRKPLSSSASSSSVSDKTSEKEKGATVPLASQAAQAAHLAMLFPCPRLPTVEDVCTTCEQALLAPGQDAKHLTDTTHTLFCHGLCGRTWHRKCATVSESTTRGPSPSASAAAAASPSPTPSGIPLNINAPTPSTHVMPFQPLTTPYWYCNECLSLQGHCFSCFKSGSFDPLVARIPHPQHPRRKVENPDFLQQCPFQGGCGRLYHRQCLFELPRTMTHKPSRNNAGGKDAGAVLFSPNLIPRPRAGLICALHACDSCGSAGTASTNVRDIGRTLVHCLRCPVAYHWSTKCRREDDTFKPTTKKFGVCSAHEETGEDAEDADVIQRRNQSIANLTLSHAIPPTQLFGTEPVEPEDSSDESDDEEDDEDEDEEDDEPPAASHKNKADGEAPDAPKPKKQRT